MFINRCLKLLKLELSEGLHYQIAFYGGRLRSHCTFDELEPEFVNLLRLCRHAAIVCDSDKRDEVDGIDGSKRRLAHECEAAGGLSWVTDGREVENYLPDSVLSAAFTELFERPIALSLGQYEKLSDSLSRAVPDPKHGEGWKATYEENKARVMPTLLKHLEVSHLDRWGLKRWLNELVRRIRNANGGRELEAWNS